MYKVTLLGQTKYNYIYYYFNSFSVAFDFSVKHYNDFVRLEDNCDETIYNNVEYNNGCYIFSYCCEYLG